MSDPLLDNIEDILSNGGVPQRVTNKSLFRGLQAIWGRLGDNTDCLSDIANRLEVVEHRVDHLEETQRVNPSLIAYVKEHPRAAAIWFVSVLLFMTLALSFSEPLRSWVAALLP